jgi:hypothetical protein
MTGDDTPVCPEPVCPEPGPDNGFLAEHVALLASSLRHWTGRTLTPEEVGDKAGARWLFEDAPFALLSHGTGADPCFTYANRRALALFEIGWDELLRLPSRLSAEPMARAERERLLAAVTARGFIDDYQGVRISRRGRRFLIRRATVWNLIDTAGSCQGQAAMFARWQPLDGAALAR